MKQEIAKIQKLLLNHLYDDLKANHPDYVEMLKGGNAENSYNAQEAKEFLNEPIEPWTTLLNALLDFELGYDLLKLTVEKGAATKDGRERYFFTKSNGLYLSAALERLRYFATKLKRSDLAIDTDRIVEFIGIALKEAEVKGARNRTAHGYFTDKNKSATTIESEYVWEPYSVISVDEDHFELVHNTYGYNTEKYDKDNKERFDSNSESMRNALKTILDSLLVYELQKPEDDTK